MNVLMTSTSYPADMADWRGVFIRNLAGGLGRAEHLNLKLWAPPGLLPPKVVPVATPSEAAWLGELMQAGGVAHLIRRRNLRSLAAPAVLLKMLSACFKREIDVDVYHINWMQCALPLPRNGKPVLIAVLGNDLKLLKLPFVRSLLRRSMRGRRVILSPNADWMTPALDDAFGDIATIEPVSFGIDDVWYGIERQLAPKPKWIAVTRLTKDKLGPLFEWSEPLFRGQDRELHLFGPMQEQIVVPDWIHYHGSATPEELSSQWFPVAQGLITLSVHAEGRPQTMLEAMAGGLPIIASDMPAHASLVRQNESGYLVGDQEAYRSAVEALEEPGTNSRYGANARARADVEFGTWDDAAERYATLYRKLGAPIDA